MTSDSRHTSRSFLAWPIWATYGALLVIAVPWYWPAENEWTFLGAPAWFATSLLASVAISIFTAWLLMTRWPAEEAEADE